MKQIQITLAKILTFSGTLPIIGSALLIYIPFADLKPAFVATAYSAIIISFLSGIHWAVYLFFAEKCPRNLLITSNATALLAWISLLITNSYAALLIQSLCFLYLLKLDWTLFKLEILPKWFYGLRQNATMIVLLFIVILVCLI